MIPVRILLAIGLLAASAALAQRTPTVYVTFDKSEDVPSDKRRDLADSAQDLREHLAKRASLRRAEADHDADVTVTILDRRLEVNRSGRNDWGGALSQTHYESRYVLSFRVELDGEMRQESEIALAGAFVTWKRVAGVLAKDVEKWARDHRFDD